MKTLEDLRQCYEKDLMPNLLVLEKQRKVVSTKITYIFVAVLILAIPLTVLIKNAYPLLLGVIVCAFLYRWLIKEYVAAFKNDIIERIIRLVDPNLKYSKFGYIPRYSFTGSKLFLKNPDEYDGDDHVTGKIGETSLEFSEINARYVTYNSKGGRQEHTIFKGLFLTADFNKHFKSTTVILPDTAEKLFGHMGAFFQSKNVSRGQLVKLEDPEFERHFVVYGQDQIEARYVLSTSLMKRITDFKKKSGRNVFMSFVGSKIYVAISYARNLFEPRVFKTVLDFAPIQQYFEDLKLAIDVIEDLNLNTRIWGK